MAEVDKREEPMIRLMEYRAILDGGGELTPEQLEDLQEIANEIVAMIQRFVEALRPVAEAIVKFVGDFVAQLNEATGGRWEDIAAQIAAVDMEKILPNTDLGVPVQVSLVSEEGEVLETVETGTISMEPMEATSHISQAPQLFISTPPSTIDNIPDMPSRMRQGGAW